MNLAEIARIKRTEYKKADLEETAELNLVMAGWKS